MTNLRFHRDTRVYLAAHVTSLSTWMASVSLAPPAFLPQPAPKSSFKHNNRVWRGSGAAALSESLISRRLRDGRVGLCLVHPVDCFSWLIVAASLAWNAIAVTFFIKACYFRRSWNTRIVVGWSKDDGIASECCGSMEIHVLRWSVYSLLLFVSCLYIFGCLITIWNEIFVSSNS